MSDVRVRLAPSPTGYLHLGVTRTALYNWLTARSGGGSFILRIEDTDRERSTDEFLEAIITDLRWLGLDWDEGPEVEGPHGPYLQSQRGGTYAPFVERLVQEGAAYRCYCTPEELEERRSARSADEAEAWKYDRKCASLSRDEREALERAGRPHVIRFRVPGGKTSFVDAIQGPVEFENDQFDDLVIARRDGTPTYNMAVVIDDMEMRVTHVIRGSDHLTNTPRQIMMWRALGHEPPVFAHMPLLFGQDGKVLSKRRGAVSIGEYRRMGYLPEAIVNYIALLGWASESGEEILSLEQLADEFELSKLSRKPSTFDPDKLVWINAQWMKRLSVPERTERLLPVLRDEGLVAGELTSEEREWLERVVDLIDDRLKTVRDVLDFDWFFLASGVTYDSMAVSKVLDKPGAGEILAGLRKVLSDAPDFTTDALETAIRSYAEEKGVSAGKAIQPLRVAVTGKTASPGMFETLSLLGRHRVLARVDAALELSS
ncbi:MAG: glutamate--tRNA ligase [Candidatus Eisenbacteria bacterium]|nr:glutamate--tRNA ligase [Candidatus Eisenbacteria bacterium]